MYTSMYNILQNLLTNYAYMVSWETFNVVIIWTAPFNTATAFPDALLTMVSTNSWQENQILICKLNWMETCYKIVCTLLWEQEVLIRLKLVLGEEVTAEMLTWLYMKKWHMMLT